MPPKPRKRGPVVFKTPKAVSLFKTKAPGAYPYQLSRTVIATVVKMVAAGVPYSVAAHAVGISSARIQKWRAKGEEIAQHLEDTLDWPEGTTSEDKLCYEFAIELNKHTAKSAVHAIKKVRSGMDHDWRAAAWWLDRKVDGFSKPTPGAYGSTGPGNAPPVQVVIYEPPSPRGPSA